MDWMRATAELTKKLDPSHVKGRKQGGGEVQYIEGWRAIAEANRIFGFGAWDRETTELRQLGEPRDVGGKIRVEYLARVSITVRLGDGAAIRHGCGFGQGIDRDVGQAHESALKEAETDAMKRALMTFGNPFGLALYDKERENVGVEVSAEDIEARKQAGPRAQKIIDQVMAAETEAEIASTWGSTRDERFEINEASPDEYDRIKAAVVTRKAQLTSKQEAA